MTRALPILLLCLVCASGLLVRLPLVTVDTPYIYHQDDGHHFNRTVEMAQRGDLNPHYFNKPSLHFYLRIPIVAASVAAARHHGELQSVDEIRTRDPFGLAGYSFTASHPRVLEWNRMFSVALSIAMIAVTFVAAFLLTRSSLLAAFAAAVPAFSPEVVANSHIIGVDILMALMCIVVSTTAITICRKPTTLLLSLLGLLCGLAISSKYNAAPICIVPLAAAVVGGRVNVRTAAAASAATICGFFLGTPYALVSFSEFWRGVTYESWHYAVAGHEGHTAERGLPQAIFYADWFLTDGVGISVAALVVLGFAALARRSDTRAAELVFASFPVVYVLMMIFQRANFTRNMVVVVPYAGVIGAIGLQLALRSLRVERVRTALLVLVSLLSILPISNSSRAYIAAKQNHPESRRALADWIESLGETGTDSDVAIARQLQMPTSIFAAPGIDAFDPAKIRPTELFSQGYSFVVLPNWSPTITDTATLPVAFTINGDSEPSKIPDNPAVIAFRADAATVAALPAQEMRVNLSGKENQPCAIAPETHCWTRTRRTLVSLEASPLDTPTKLTFELMSPWHGQRAVITTAANGSTPVKAPLNNPGEWTRIELSVPSGTSSLVIDTSIIHSPRARGVGGDDRRLGIAMRGFTVVPMDAVTN